MPPRVLASGPKPCGGNKTLNEEINVWVNGFTFVERYSKRPGSYSRISARCRMQFKQKIMKQIISLSIVSIAFDTAEMQRMNQA